jgi:glycosyltransferase 2 family protein
MQSAGDGELASPLDRPRAGPARRAFNIALLLLPLGVLANLAYTLLATDRSLLRALGELPRIYLLAALGLTLVPWLTGTLRLLVWSRFLGYRLRAADLLRMTLVVDLGAAVSPTAIGGEAFRWGMLVSRGVKPGEAATLTLLPKLEDAVFFAIALPVALAWTRPWELVALATGVDRIGTNAVVVLGAFLLVAVVAWLVLRSVLRGRAGEPMRAAGLRRWGRTRRRLRVAWADARVGFRLVLTRGRWRFALTLALTALHWIGRYSVVMALALFLGIPFDPVLFWLLQWVVFTVMTFTPTPGAAGGAEIAFTAVYASLLPGGAIGVMTAAWRLFTFYVPVALAAVVFALLQRADRARRPA